MTESVVKYLEVTGLILNSDGNVDFTEFAYNSILEDIIESYQRGESGNISHWYEVSRMDGSVIQHEEGEDNLDALKTANSNEQLYISLKKWPSTSLPVNIADLIDRLNIDSLSVEADEFGNLNVSAEADYIKSLIEKASKGELKAKVRIP